MRLMDGPGGRAATVAGLVFAAAAAIAAAEPQSPRLDRAKDYIADERWSRAIEELKAAAADVKEASRDEALFWLAHCLNQSGDAAPAIETIRRLEQQYPKSRWVKPARSLRIEIAQRLKRFDVLWWTALAPPSVPAAARVKVKPAVAPEVSQPPTPPAPRAPVPPAPEAFYFAPNPPPPPPTPAPPLLWLPDDLHSDLELRIQAMGSLILGDFDDVEKVIPILREIALEASAPGQARRALFALAQSKRPEARLTVVEVARKGPEPVQIEAVRALARFRGAEISSALLQVYSGASDAVKLHVVHSLGHRAEPEPLLRIAASESNRHLRDAAIVTLGRTPGGHVHLRGMYDTAPPAARRAIIVGLFNARDDDGLIRVAMRERQSGLRREALERLRLLGTPKAKRYLELHGRN